MAIALARSGKPVNVRPLGPRLAQSKTTTIEKTNALEIIHLVIRAGTEIPPDKVPGEITVQCPEGRVAFTAGGVTGDLGGGDRLYLPVNEPHTLRGIKDSLMLVTVLLD